MIMIRTGTNRRVLLIGRCALKFPLVRHPAFGLNSNRWECEMWFRWRPKFKWDQLCPVLFADPLGIVVVMPRAAPADPSAVSAAIERDGNSDPLPTSELRPEGYGMVQGRVVCFDYGLADPDMIRDKRDYYARFPSK